jgi:cold shock CspA family protein
MAANLCRGRLTKWNDERGFGFIQPVDKGQTVYLHISDLKDSTRRPQLDDMICYYVIADKDGKLRANNAFILGARRKLTPFSRSLTDNEKLSFPLQEIVLLSILPLVASIHFFATTRNPLPFILYPVMSILTYTLYANDKSRAKVEVHRTNGEEKVELHQSEKQRQIQPKNQEYYALVD